MNKQRLLDASARDRISKDLDACFFVEAGAGSGKTFSLVNRVVGLLRNGRAKVEEIAVVTFTRKAAAELRERIQIELEKLFRGDKAKEEEKTRIDAALQTVERASISTIHSFCARILRERPVEAGVDPGFEEIEEDDDKIFAKRSWAEFIEKQGREGTKVIGWIRDNGVSPALLEDIYLRLVRYPDVEAVREDAPRPDFTETKKTVGQFIRAMRKKIPGEEPPDGWDSLQDIVVRCLRLADIGYLEEDRLFVELLKKLDRESGVTLNRWPKKDGKERFEEMAQFRDEVVRPALRLWRGYLHKPLIEFAMEGARYYAEWRRERSLLNFQDLLMLTADLLRGSAEVRSYFKKRIRYLLVDEFQDTDPIQAEIVMLLAGENDAENSWRRIKPRKGALFLVGDPKQSIYRFRRADIDIFNSVKRMFREGAGEVLELTSNFRSLDPVRDITDTVFRAKFPPEETQYQAKFAPLMTTRGNGAGFDGGVFENPIPKHPGNRPGEVAETDAAVIASWMHGALKGSLRLERTKEEKANGKSEQAEPGDFMIITRLKKHLHLYARALEARGIPYEITGGENFNRSEELYEIYKVMKSVADPSDPVALLAALRGIFFGVSDNDLYLFSRGGGRFSCFFEGGDGQDIVVRSLARLKELHAISTSHTPMTAVEKIVEILGVLPFALSKATGATRGGNIFKAIELLRESGGDGTGSFAELVDRMREMRETESIEEMSLFPGTTKAVRIMNLHKAKGLEAPVVILADPLGMAGDHEPMSHVRRLEDSSLGYFALPVPKGEYGYDLVATPRDWEDYAEEEKKYENAEKMRLDYVAVTRAKNMLIVSTYREGKRKRAWGTFESYLADMPKVALKVMVEPIARETVEIDEGTLDKAKELRDESLAGIKKETYHRLTVTAMAKPEAVITGERGDGTAWGRIVHNAWEACAAGKRSKLEILARNWITEEERPPEDLERLTKLVDGIMASSLWQRMLKSDERYFELPFSTMRGDTIIRGAIDLLFHEKDGWVIVDYKTDDFEKDPVRKSAYQKQLSLYAELWSEISGEKVKETFLHKV